jgi:hypothetical protein
MCCFLRKFNRFVVARLLFHFCSRANAQVVLAIEEEFAIEISHEDAERVNSVADAIAYISSHAHVSHLFLPLPPPSHFPSSALFPLSFWF